jgi:hypothetical protein
MPCFVANSNARDFELGLAVGYFDSAKTELGLADGYFDSAKTYIIIST